MTIEPGWVGSSVQRRDGEAGMTCPRCGVGVPAGSKFCGECGADQTGSRPVAAVAADPRIGTVIE